MKVKLAKMETLVLITLSLLVSVEVFPQAICLSPVLQTTVLTERLFYAQGELVKITGNTMDTTGASISGSTVALEVRDTSSNTVFLDITTTYMNGSFSDSFRLTVAAPSGTYTVYAVASKAGYGSAQNQTTFNVGSSTGVAFAVWTQKSQYMRFENVLVYGRVLNYTRGLQDALVTFHIVFPNETTWTTITNTTDATGTATQSFYLPPTIPAGQYQINASSYKDAYPNATATGTFTIQNREPTISQVSINPQIIEKPGSTSIQANASDYEDYQNITVVCIITLANETIQLYNMSLVNSTFSMQYAIHVDYPASTYSVTIRAVDKDSGSAEYHTSFEVVTPVIKGAASGLILNTANQGIANATVTLSLKTAFLTYTSTTDTQGYYGFSEAMPGQYSLIVSAQEYQSKTVDMEIAGSLTSDQNVTLSHLPILWGYVMAQDGRPISNATITATGNSGALGLAYTMYDGSYRLIISSQGALTVIASASLFSPNSSGIICSLEQIIEQNFTLIANGALTGQVLDALSSSGVANATAVLYGIQFTGSCQTDSAGRFSYNSLNPGNYTLIVTEMNYLPKLSAVSIYSNQTTILQTMLMPTGNITGTVRDSENNNPIQDATVTLLDHDGVPLAAVSTNHSGEYLFYLVQPANYTIKVTARGYNSTIASASPIAHDVQTITFSLTPNVILLDLQPSSMQYSQGETVQLTISAKNVQGQSIADNITEIMVTLKGPNNETRILNPYRQSDAFATSYLILNNDTIGMWTATAYVQDRLGNEAETVEAIWIMQAFLVDFRTDKSSYVPTETINFTAYVQRYSNLTQFVNSTTVTASVEVFNPLNTSIANLNLTMSSNAFVDQYSHSALTTGTYTAYLNVSDSNGNCEITTLTFLIAQDFHVILQTDKTLYNRTETVHIFGNLTFTNGTMATNANVLITLNVRGYSRIFSAPTNNSGYFEYFFTPLGFDSGNYTLTCSSTIDGIERSATTYFSVLGLCISPSNTIVSMSKNSFYEFTEQINNQGEIRLTGVSIIISPSNTGGVTATVTIPPRGVLEQKSGTTLTIRINASTGATDDATFNLIVTCDQGAIEYGIIEVQTHPATPSMDVKPQLIDLSMPSAQYLTETVTVSNIGYGTLLNVSATPPSIEWVSLTSTFLGDIAPQDSQAFDVLINPPNTTTVGLYQGQIQIRSANYPSTTVYLVVKITTAQNGSATFHVADDTGADVPNARVTLQCGDYWQQAYTELSNSTGSCTFPNLIGGRYSYVVSADSHETVSGTVTVQPGSTAYIEVKCPSQLMDVKFSVTPTTIKDKGCVNLTMTFSTEVPPPMLIPVPILLQFQVNRANVSTEGYDSTMYFSLINSGLISIKDVSVAIQGSSPDGYYLSLGDFGQSIPLQEIKAKQMISLPCRLIIDRGANVTVLSKGIVNKIKIQGSYIFFDENSNPKTMGIEAEVVVQIVDISHRALMVNPPWLFIYQRNDLKIEVVPAITDTFSSTKLPNIAITNCADTENVYLYDRVIGGGGSGNVDLVKFLVPPYFGAGLFCVVGKINKQYVAVPSYVPTIGWGGVAKLEGPDPFSTVMMSQLLKKSASNLLLQPKQSAIIQAEKWDLPGYASLDPADWLSLFFSVKVISFSAGTILFFYHWEYDQSPSVYFIPIFMLEVNFPTINIPIPIITLPFNLTWGVSNGDVNAPHSEQQNPPRGGGGGGYTQQYVYHVDGNDVLTVHEIVKLSIPQEVTLERDAFTATLQMTNRMPSTRIENVRVNLVTTSNGTDARDQFYVNARDLQSISAIDGTGIIEPGATATVTWPLVPKPGAGGTDETGVYYDVQASIFYSVNQTYFNVSSSTSTIRVEPQPLLALDYYLPKEVVANVPFKLAVRVRNVGYGTAHNFKIDSAQPTIYENLAGLLTNFQLLGTFVQGTQSLNSLRISFGDIAPRATVIGYWIMVTTLSGNFTAFNATYTHSNALGGEETSLVQAANAHILLRDVMLDDACSAFLVGLDNNAVPEQIVDSSSGTAFNVVPVEYNITRHDEMSIDVQTQKYVDSWIWICLDDPFNNTKEIEQVQRSDGKILKEQNYWTGDNKINIVDDAEENYTITFAVPDLKDIALKNASVFRNKTVICKGYSLILNVTVQNEGLLTETFNVTVYANNTLIGEDKLTLQSSESITFSMTWNTSGFAKGNYTIWAHIPPIPGETHMEDNTLIIGVVTLSMVGDLIPDGIVDIFDIVKVASAFSSVPGDLNWNSDADINNDGVVDIFDIVIVAAKFGYSDP